MTDETPGTEDHFGVWIADCDTFMVKKYGLGVEDMPDWRWSDAYDDGLSPSEAAASYSEEMDE